MGEGSQFQFDIQVEVLPSKAASAPKHQAREIVGIAGPESSYRMLVVDDQYESRELLKQLLSSVGFEVAEADSGEALH